MTLAPFPHDYLQSDRWTWHIPSPAVEDAVRKLVLSDDCLVKATAVRAVYRVGDFHLKFERAPSLMGRVRNCFRPKARREYAIGVELAQSGVPAVECLGWGQLGGTNVLITRTFPGSVPVEEYFYKHVIEGGENPDGFLADVTAFLKKFFDAGFCHGDLHFGNILYQPETHKMAWVDLIAISHLDSLTHAEIAKMSRCLVTFRGGLNQTQMLRLIRDVGAASTDAEAEKFYFDELVRTSRHLAETWGKRRDQILTGYSKFTDVVPCPGNPMKTILLRKDWLARPLLTKEDVANGLPAGYERFFYKFSVPGELPEPKEELEAELAERLFLTSMCLQILRVKHRRIAAFIRPNELWLEPMPDGLATVEDNAPGLEFYTKELHAMGIEVRRLKDLRRLPDGSFYLPLVVNGEATPVFMGGQFDV